MMPILFHSFSHGPIPRFANWLVAYGGICITLIVACLNCMFNPFFGVATCPICLLCFDKNTLIDVDDNSTKKISELSIGEKIKGGEILGIIEMEENIYELYKYSGILVTGGHLVFHKGKWVRVESIGNTEKLCKTTKLYCLITSGHNIFSNNIKFRDYQETEDRDITQIINYRVALGVNNNELYITNKDDYKHQYYWGFGGNTLVKINNNYEKISDIVNNKITDSNIFGFITLKKHNIKFFDLDNIIVSGTTLYKNDTNDYIWERVHQKENIQEISYNEDIVYHLLTKNNIIEVMSNTKTYYFRDFVELNDKQVNNKIDTMVENRLNIMLY